jgi:hypothetical protein
MNLQPPIQLGLSTAFHNKTILTGSERAFGDSFIQHKATTCRIVDHLLAGKAITVAHCEGNTRKNETFISAQLIALDCDHNVSVADALNHPFIREYALLVYATASSAPDNYRTRIVFQLSEAIEGSERYRTIVAGLIRHLGLDIDPASLKPVQPYFGSTNRLEEPHRNENAMLPLALLGGLTRDLAHEDYAEYRHRMETVCIPLKGDRAERRAQTTLNNQLAKLASAPDGSRNETLYKTAWFLFSSANGNWPGIDHATVQRELEAIVRGWPNVHKSLDTIQRAQHAASAILLEDRVYPTKAGEGELSDFSTKLPKNLNIAADCADTDLRCWPGGVPDSMRSALRKYTPPSMRLFIEFLNTAVARELIDPDALTVQACFDAAPDLGYSLPLRTLQRLLNTSFFEFMPNSAIEEERGTTTARSGVNPNGRPANVYCWLPTAEFQHKLLQFAEPRIMEKYHLTDGVILPILTAAVLKSAGEPDEVALAEAVALAQHLEPAYHKQNGAEKRARQAAQAELNRLAESLQDTTSTVLPVGWEYRNWKDHAAAQVRAYVQAQEGCHQSYRFWREWLGVAEGEVSDILKRAGIRNERQTAQAAIRAGADLVEQVKQHAYALKGHPETLLIEYPSGKRMAIEYQYAVKDPEALERVRRDISNHLANGAAVKLELRTASRQRIETEGQPRPAKPPASARATAVNPSGKSDAPVERKPADPAFYGQAYSPAVLRKWFLRAMELMDWPQHEDGRFITLTGELIANDASERDLLAALLEAAGVGEPPLEPLPPDGVPQAEVDADPFLRAAKELGAVILRVSP